MIKLVELWGVTEHRYPTNSQVAMLATESPTVHYTTAAVMRR